VTGWTAGLRAITFDFGNTLVPVGREDLRRAVELTADRIVARSGPFSRDAFLAAWAQERERQFAEEVPAFREVDIAQRFVRVFARLRGLASPPPGDRWDDEEAAARSTAEEIVSAVDAYVEGFVATIPPPPTVRPLLERLARRYRLGVLSNWPLAATIDRYVEAASWAPYLSAVVVSERVGTIKPHPAMFRDAEAKLGGLEPRTILHVGDDWVGDVVGAKRAGWNAAYLHGRPDGSPLPLSERDDEVHPDLELDRLTDLEAHL
jgi:HAD superfamily hydrolase (TIGR01549 family)